MINFLFAFVKTR